MPDDAPTLARAPGAVKPSRAARAAPLEARSAPVTRRQPPGTTPGAPERQAGLICICGSRGRFRYQPDQNLANSQPLPRGPRCTHQLEPDRKSAHSRGAGSTGVRGCGPVVCCRIVRRPTRKLAPFRRRGQWHAGCCDIRARGSMAGATAWKANRALREPGTRHRPGECRPPGAALRRMRVHQPWPCQTHRRSEREGA